MSSDHRDVDVVRVQSHAVGDEGVRSANVEGRDAEELLGVVHSRLLEDLGGDRYGRVDGVADDGCFWKIGGRKVKISVSSSEKIREHFQGKTAMTACKP